MFSALISLVILIGDFMEHGQKDRCVVCFQRLVILNFFYNLFNSIVNFYLLLGGVRDNLFTHILDFLLALSYVGILLMIAKFMVTYIARYQDVSGWWMVAARIFVWTSTIICFIYMTYAVAPHDILTALMLRRRVDAMNLLYSVFLLILVLRYRKCFTAEEWLSVNSIIILPAFAALVRIRYPQIVSVQLSITLSSLLINSFLHMKQAERLREQEKKLMENQTQLMISQIRPHFVFNVLNTIHILCELEPLKAQSAIEHFSMYLRRNLDILSGTDTMIPVRNELEHVEHYLQLEKMRYGDDLNVIMDISGYNFWIPSLTIQPIVENAVKHGIQRRPNGGTIFIRTQETEDYYEVYVEDNGRGFDPQEEKNDGKQHVGLRNVRERLAALCSGDLTVHSMIGEGTMVRMRLPKGEMQEEMGKVPA